MFQVCSFSSKMLLLDSLAIFRTCKNQFVWLGLDSSNFQLINPCLQKRILSLEEEQQARQNQLGTPSESMFLDSNDFFSPGFDDSFHVPAFHQAPKPNLQVRGTRIFSWLYKRSLSALSMSLSHFHVFVDTPLPHRFDLVSSAVDDITQEILNQNPYKPWKILLCRRMDLQKDVIQCPIKLRNRNWAQDLSPAMELIEWTTSKRQEVSRLYFKLSSVNTSWSTLAMISAGYHHK